MADNLTTFMCRLSWNLGASTSWNPQGLSRPVMVLPYLHHYYCYFVIRSVVRISIQKAVRLLHPLKHSQCNRTATETFVMAQIWIIIVYLRHIKNMMPWKQTSKYGLFFFFTVKFSLRLSLTLNSTHQSDIRSHNHNKYKGRYTSKGKRMNLTIRD